MQPKHLSSSATSLLATDMQGSILRAHTKQAPLSLAYATYGFDPRAISDSPQLRFNAKLRTVAGFYLLGSYRAYNPILMRFHSPDNLSPFEGGSINAYAYCSNDPVNFSDPSGHMKKRTSIQDQLRPIVTAQIFHQESKTNKTNQLSALKKNQPKAEARLQTILTELKADDKVYGKEKMHRNSRYGLETEKTSLLSDLVKIDKLPSEIASHEAALLMLDKKNDAIEVQIGKARFDEQFKIAFHAAIEINRMRQESN
ncbi:MULTISPECIES: RHS repeat-associated core domain-containing protein [Pseudomonas]|uniref:RHS repeat-associated core domain-containing protein n=1 Tax=Pseudomonas soli TaxID=1306993 RepID=A0A2V4I6U2_9PSED|nr:MULTISPECIES: RHS repeat-associated core domain-containing protein [Pseudomonas]PYB82453.1 hypothetical protein DMX07_12355 [Pseudomonas soli]PZW80417.1 RHS repeat-associated protein [Pseudomonas sp. 2848]